MKSLVYISKYLIFLVINFIFEGEPTLQLNAPQEVDAGNVYNVEVTLETGEISRFARFQQELPYGLQARRIETANADFVFEDQKIKFIWLKLPEEQNTLTISYEVEFDERLMGDFNLGGTFSYISNNERKHVDIQPTAVHINPSPNVAQSIDVNEFKEYITPAPSEVDQLACIRQKPYKAGENNEYVVNLLVYKKDKEKFAKIEEKIPEGYQAVSDESKEPLFTFKDQIAKFIWMNLPPNPYFVVSYRLVPEEDATDSISIDGQFSYVENGNTMIIDIIEQGGIELANQEQDYYKQVINDAAVEIAQANVTESSTFETVENQGDIMVSDEGAPTPMLEPEEGVYYRVQVAAGHKPVDIEEYFSQYNLKHEVKSEKHEGWIKYSIGAFNIYKDARDYRVYVWNTTEIDDAFVAAYNSGRRITVQEALMIANQKWYR